MFSVGYGLLVFAVRHFAAPALFAVGTAAAVIVLDTAYFQREAAWATLQDLLFGSRSLSSMTFTTWNGLQYNLVTENLAEHGIHPHYAHVAANLPLLFGALGVIALVLAIKSIVQVVRYNVASAPVGSVGFAPSSDSPAGHLVLVSSLSLISALGFLSMAPHQVR